MKAHAEQGVRIEIPARLDAVAPARRDVNRFLAGRGAGSRKQREFGLIVTELLNNAIENRPAGDRGPIEIQVQVERGRVRLSVRGGSSRTGARELKRALADCEPRDADAERGRGLFLVKCLTEKVGVKSLSGSRTEIWVTKKL